MACAWARASMMAATRIASVQRNGNMRCSVAPPGRGSSWSAGGANQDVPRAWGLALGAHAVVAAGPPQSGRTARGRCHPSVVDGVQIRLPDVLARLFERPLRGAHEAGVNGGGRVVRGAAGR